MRVQRVAVLLLVLTAIALFAPVAGAQSPDNGRLNLTTSPLPIKLIAEPGETITTDLRIKNSGNTPERLQVDLMKFSAYGEEGKPRLEERAEGDTYFDWVQFSEKIFNAEPNVWNTIRMTISVPSNGAFGYYYAVTFSRAAPADPGDEVTGVEGATAVLVLLEVNNPGATRTLELVEFSSTKGIYEFLPAEFVVRMRNNGNVHASPSGTVFISKGGTDIAQLSLNSGGGSILPDSVREFTTPWNDGFPRYEEKIENGQTVKSDDGDTIRSLKWNWGDAESLRFGKYTATLLAVYDDGTRDVPVEASIEFWVLPWRIIGLGLLIVAIVGVGMFTLFRKIWRGARSVSKKRHEKK
jgi:hypothetical protein